MFNLLRSFRAQRYEVTLYKANQGYAVEKEMPEPDLPVYQQRCRVHMCPGFPQHIFGHGNPCEHRKDLALRYGKASPKSFRRLHPSSFLETSNLLVVCRRIYDEARLVPFTSNNFVLHVNNGHELGALFETDHKSPIKPWQLNAI